MAGFTILPTPIVVDRDMSSDEFFNHLKALPYGWSGRIAFDTETTGLDIVRDIPVFGSVSDGVNRWLMNLENLIDPRFAELIADPERFWVMANAKYDMHMTANVDLPEFAGTIIDTAIMCALRDENRKGGAGLGLKEQSRDYLNIKMRSFKDTFDIRVKKSDEGRALLEAPIDIVAGYASLDAYATWLLSEAHIPLLEAEELPENLMGFKTLADYMWGIEVPFTKTLWRMERRGVPVDTEYLMGLKTPMENLRDAALADIMQIAGRPINPGSPKQLGACLYGSQSEGGLGVKPFKWTRSGQPSTEATVLEKLRHTVPLAEKVLQWRKYSQLISTQIDKVVGIVTEDRIHTTFNQAGAVTGRLSCKEPNMMGVPKKGDSGYAIRKAYVAPKHGALLVKDFSQVEMCIMAHMSGDPSMVNAICEGLDLHSFTASEMLGVDYEHVILAKEWDDLEPMEGEEAESFFDRQVDLMAEYNIVNLDAHNMLDRLSGGYADDLLAARAAAKAIGFGLMYGRGPGALADQLGVTRKKAKSLIDDWFHTFPSVRTYIEDVQRVACEREDHAVHTVFGRPRRLTGITSSNNGIRNANLRKAINAPIQGSAACIMKWAMLKIDQDPELGGDCLAGGSTGAQLLLQVHDEIIMSLPDNEEAEWILKKVTHIMDNAATLLVPLKTSGGIALNWAEAK